MDRGKRSSEICQKRSPKTSVYAIEWVLLFVVTAVDDDIHAQ